MRELLPSDLFELRKTVRRFVAFDTETSGKYADDGARTSTVSVGFLDPEGHWQDAGKKWSNVTYGVEEIAPGYFEPVVSMAWPFDQGREGKAEDNGQIEFDLFASENLERGEWDALCQFLLYTGERQGLTAHYATFDIEKMRVGCRRWPGVGVDLTDVVDWDTGLTNRMLWPLERAGLKETLTRLYGAGWDDESKIVKAYLKKHRFPSGRWDLIPWDIIGTYANKDARGTAMLQARQQFDILNRVEGTWFPAAADVMRAVDRRSQVMRVLTRMEWRGLPYDEVDSRLAAEQCEERAISITDDLPFNPTDEQAKQFFFGTGLTKRGMECLNMPPYGITEKNQPSLTAEILERMVADGVPWAKQWAEYKKVTNAASMWYVAYANAMGTDGRLRTRFRQDGTTSTRFSVERVNLQAIPQDYRLSSHSILEGIPTPRQLIGSAVAKYEGWRLWELDLAQAELRVGALFAGCDKMLQMIANQADLHAYTTLELFPDVSEDDPEFFKWRQVGKRGNFSLGFGSGSTTFSKMISKETGIVLPDHEADRIVRQWNRLYPEWGQAIDKHSRVVAKRQAKYNRGWVDLLNKERRWWAKFEDVHKAFNQRVQGNLAQFGIDWMMQSDAYLRSCGMDEFYPEINGRAGLLLTIHDSQAILVPDTDEGEAMINTCAEFGRHLWKEWFPGVPGGVDVKPWTKK